MCIYHFTNAGFNLNPAFVAHEGIPSFAVDVTLPTYKSEEYHAGYHPSGSLDRTLVCYTNAPVQVLA